MLPPPSQGDPERENDQPEIKQEATLPYVQKVVSKLASTWNVALGVYLRDARQTGLHAVSSFVSRYFLHMRQLPITVRLNFLRQERPRSNEAHIASKDIPELGEFIHRRGAQ